MPTSVLEVQDDYHVPLLRLLSTLEGGQGQAREVLRLFGERYKDNIPDDHYELLSSGRPRWQNYVRWARQSLKDQGLMDAPAHGVWRITEAGRQWLQEHPEATRLEPERRPRRTRRRRTHTPARPDVTLEQLKATKAMMPLDQFRQIWGELYDQLLAEERARSKTTISNRELGIRARAVLREVHDFLDGNAAASPTTGCSSATPWACTARRLLFLPTFFRTTCPNGLTSAPAKWRRRAGRDWSSREWMKWRCHEPHGGLPIPG